MVLLSPLMSARFVDLIPTRRSIIFHLIAGLLLSGTILLPLLDKALGFLMTFTMLWGAALLGRLLGEIIVRHRMLPAAERLRSTDCSPDTDPAAILKQARPATLPIIIGLVLTACSYVAVVRFAGERGILDTDPRLLALVWLVGLCLGFTFALGIPRVTIDYLTAQHIAGAGRRLPVLHRFLTRLNAILTRPIR